MNLAVRYEDDAADRRHVPVMVEEVCGLLSAHGPLAFVDVTVGTGGHAEAMLRASKARMLGLDRDAAAIAVARDRLVEFGDRVVLERADFGEIAAVMKQHHFDGADAMLADLGMSSYALDDPNRGFSFRLDGPLDMRMDDRQTLQAKDIVNEESAEEIARIIYTYGEERGSRRIARMIVEARRRGPIETTGELRAIVERALGAHRRGGAHPATRTFQALRIAVNHEMESLAALLRDGPALLNPGGRMLVISYHSLEDRPVKERFRDLARTEDYTAIARKVIKPSSAETVAQSARAQRESPMHRTERTMSARVKPTRRPSKVMPAILGALIAMVGFATLMTRLQMTTEGYRLSALHDEIAKLQDENRGLRLTAAQLSSHERLRALAPRYHLAPPGRGQVVMLP